DQAAILSTCNRVELYGVSRSRASERQLASFIADYHSLEASHVSSLLDVYRGDPVAYRLAATAAGVQSLLVWGGQIQGQIRRALELAVRAGTARAQLCRLFESAIAAGRRVRSRTAIGRGAVSVPYASVEFARRRVGHLGTVLVIGTGDTGELVAKQLVKRGAKELLVLGRTRTRARRL